MSKDLSYKEKSLVKSRWQAVLRSVSVVSLAISIFFVAQVLGILTLSSILELLGINREKLSTMLSTNIFIQFLSISFIEYFIIVLLFLWYLYHKKPFLKSVKIDKKPKLMDVLIAVITYGLYFITFVAVVFVISQFTRGFNTNQTQQLGFTSPSNTGYILVFVSLVILPAITEEILFRGFLFQRLSKIINTKVAAIITSLLFGAAHLELLSGGPINYVAATDTFILSLFLIYLLYKSNSLWPSIFLHAIKNTIAFVVLFII